MVVVVVIVQVPVVIAVIARVGKQKFGGRAG